MNKKPIYPKVEVDYDYVNGLVYSTVTLIDKKGNRCCSGCDKWLPPTNFGKTLKFGSFHYDKMCSDCQPHFREIMQRLEQKYFGRNQGKYDPGILK